MILEELYNRGFIKSEEQLEELRKKIEESSLREEEVLIKEKIVSEKFLFEIKSHLIGIPFIELLPEELDSNVLDFIPEETAKFYKIIPLRMEQGVLAVGMVYPEDLKAKEVLSILAKKKGFQYKIYLISFSNFRDLLKKYRTFKKEVKTALQELEKELKEEKKEKEEKVEIKRITEEAPVTKIVAVILRHAVDGGASDIHIEPTRKELRVRFRFLGSLYSSLFLPLKIHPAIVARIKILSKLKLDETRRPQDGRFSAKFEDRSIDFRVSTFPTAFGEKVVLRVLDPKAGLKSFEQLGLEGRNLETVKEGALKPYGLILITGPTGSGKSTTLYSILRMLNKDSVNIVTLEDPVEYYLEGINQSQVRPEIGYTFASGLRSILRQDPDIIMVGEIRDEETATLAIHAALTGHLVLSTLHTNDSLGVIPRLIDMGIKPYLISPTLQLAIAQRLVRRLCDECKKEVKAPPEIADLILSELDKLPPQIKKTLKVKKPIKIYEPQGCPKCGGKGYSGRIAIFEVLKMTPSLASLILKSLSEEDLREEAKNQGMITMRQDGILKVLKGITSIEEVLRVTEASI